MPFPSDKSRKKFYATNAWNNSEKLKEDNMKEKKAKDLEKANEEAKIKTTMDNAEVIWENLLKNEKYSYSCPECNNKIKTSDKRCSKCKNYLDWT